MGSISSSYINTTTDSISENKNTTPIAPEWELDISGLEKINFTKNHLKQIAQTGLIESHLVQASIYAFANDLEHNLVQATTSPLNFFMGIVKKGRPYTSRMPNYETPKEKAMRLFLEHEQRITENRDKVEEKLCKKAFGQWFSKMSFEEQIATAEKVYEASQSLL